MIFFARPSAKIPAATKIDRIRHLLGFGLVSWGNNSSGLKIGPATSCGKNKTYDAKDAGPILYLILFLYVSIRKAINVNVINDIPSGIAIELVLSGKVIPINDENERNKKSKYLKKSNGLLQGGQVADRFSGIHRLLWLEQLLDGVVIAGIDQTLQVLGQLRNRGR